MGLRLAALAWGLAEATLFFIVPDVLLSAVAVRDRSIALKLCLWALAGALLGGLGMYLWGLAHLEQASEVLLWIPAISEQMLTQVRADLAEVGVLATFLGPLTGTPYKIYATLAPEAGVSLLVFLGISVPARVIRFFLVALITSLLAQTVLAKWSLRARLSLLLSAWGVFYLVYFSVMPWT